MQVDYIGPLVHIATHKNKQSSAPYNSSRDLNSKKISEKKHEMHSPWRKPEYQHRKQNNRSNLQINCFSSVETNAVNNRYLKQQCKTWTSARKSSTEAAENVGTKSAPFITDVMNSFPDSANSHDIQAPDMWILSTEPILHNYKLRKLVQTKNKQTHNHRIQGDQNNMRWELQALQPKGR